MIQLRNVSHRVSPDVEAVFTKLNLDVQAGEIIGISGRNGSGKTTLLRILATLTEPTEGEFMFDGTDAVLYPELVRGRVGYVADAMFRASDLTVREHLTFLATAAGADPQVVDGVLELTDLTQFDRRALDTLSRGESRRLLLAQVMLHDPDVLLLDDPFADVDAVTRGDLLAMLDELATLGRTFVIAASLIEPLTPFCTRVGALEHGTLYIDPPLPAAPFAETEVL